MRLTCIEQELSPALNVPLLVAFADSSGTLNDLKQAELDKAERFRFANRRRDWLAGRKALKILLKGLNRPTDTMAVSFPDRHLSLTHSDGAAYAVGTPASVQGIGVDYEPQRPVNVRVANWFLTAREFDWLQQQCPHDVECHLIRLWTIKEAAFKSHAHNTGMSLKDFIVTKPAEKETNFVVAMDGTNIQVACRTIGNGYLSVAICKESS